VARAEQLGDLLQRSAGNPAQESALITRQLRRWGLFAPVSPEVVEPLREWDGEQEARHLLAAIAGRILLLEEVERVATERRLWLTHPVADLLQYLYLAGQLACRAAVAEHPAGRCLRCGSSDLSQENCLECGEADVLVCNTCGEMGVAKSCRPYYAIPAPPTAGHLPSAELVLPCALTPAQQGAAEKLQRFLRRTQPAICLFWAVCGAGKTETALPAVQQVLSAGGRVLWATPRRDVVLELLPRLESAFPGLTVAACHGAQSERFPDAPLILSTTHQALRMYGAFDLVILDEVDAFPYLHNPMLELAVRRALRPAGKLIYLTATPTDELLQMTKRGQAEQVLLPVRFHGAPLPEPELHLLRLPRPAQPWEVPPLLNQLLITSVERDLCQTLVFVPSVALAETVGVALQTHFQEHGNEGWVEYIHAADQKREQKRQRFFAGEFPILVTTTLMERGITIPRLNIIVLYADWEQVFSESALIQIAGRAGRAADYPEGRVCLLSQRRSRAMVSAKNKISGLNLAARQIAAAREVRK
jgi:competence protein ComFA